MPKLVSIAFFLALVAVLFVISAFPFYIGTQCQKASTEDDLQFCKDGTNEDRGSFHLVCCASFTIL